MRQNNDAIVGDLLDAIRIHALRTNKFLQVDGAAQRRDVVAALSTTPCSDGQSFDLVGINDPSAFLTIIPNAQLEMFAPS